MIVELITLADRNNILDVVTELTIMIGDHMSIINATQKRLISFIKPGSITKNQANELMILIDKIDVLSSEYIDFQNNKTHYNKDDAEKLHDFAKQAVSLSAEIQILYMSISKIDELKTVLVETNIVPM